MKSERLFNLIAGVTLLAIGVIALAGNVFLATKAWKLWPVIIVLAGIGLTIPGFFGFSRRGFGSFFIPGIPVLTTGAILLYASLTNHWNVWSVAWPLEILATGARLCIGRNLHARPRACHPRIHRRHQRRDARLLRGDWAMAILGDLVAH